jgi:hypothetical protein
MAMTESALFRHYRAKMTRPGEYHGWSAAASFGAIEQEYLAATRGIACFDSSFRGRLAVTGKDGLDLLNRLSTNDLHSLRPGQAIGTVLTTEKGKLVDFLTVFHGGSKLLLIVSPSKEKEVSAWIDKFTIQEEVGVEDVTSETVMVSLIGPEVVSAVPNLLPDGSSVPSVIQVSWGEILAIPVSWSNATELYLVTTSTNAGLFWGWLEEKSFSISGDALTPHAGFKVPMVGHVAYEAYRISKGIPMVDREMTERHNPYDIDLRRFISYTKGCYIGQEVIARLDTYQKARRRLAGLTFARESGLVDRGTPLTIGGEEEGWVTSVTEEPLFGARLGLAVLRNGAIVNGARATCPSHQGVAVATVCELPTRWP